MSKLQELDKLIQEFENELVLTKSVNQLATRLQQEGREQSEKIDKAQEQLVSTSSSLREAAQRFNDLGVKTASSTKEQLENLGKQQYEAQKQLTNHLDESLGQQNKHIVDHSDVVQTRLDEHRLLFKQFGEHQTEAIKQQSKLLADQFSELHIQQNKHFVDLSSTVQTRLANHRSEIRQIVEREAEKLNNLFSGKIGELETVIQKQHKTITGLLYLAVLQILLLSFATMAKVLNWW